MVKVVFVLISMYPNGGFVPDTAEFASLLQPLRHLNVFSKVNFTSETFILDWTDHLQSVKKNLPSKSKEMVISGLYTELATFLLVMIE